MWGMFTNWISELYELSGGLTRQNWMIVLGIVVVVGFFCMRGFGSRTNY